MLGEVTVPSWRILDLADSQIDLVVDHSPGLVTIGGVKGRPFLALADHRGIVDELVIPPAAAVHGPPRSVRWGEGGLIGVCGPTGLWRQDSSWEATVPGLPRDEEGNSAEWLWVMSGDGELRLVAVYPTDRGRELRIWDDQLRLHSRERNLYLLGDPRQLQVAAFAGRVVVCGQVGEVPSGSLTMWWTRSYPSPEFDLESAHPRWEQVSMETAPDLVTHGLDWGAAAFFAGVVGGAAAIWDHEGELRHSVDVKMDPNAPLVILAEAPPDEDLTSMAVQTATGGLLVHAGQAYPMPHGTLTNAVLNRGFDAPRCFAVVEGNLYILELSYD